MRTLKLILAGTLVGLCYVVYLLDKWEQNRNSIRNIVIVNQLEDDDGSGEGFSEE